MSFRTWTFGMFDAQAADFNADDWSGFRSQLAAAGNTSDQVGGVITYNPSGDSNGVLTGYAGGANPLHSAHLVQIELDQIKAKLGQIPVLLRADWSIVARSDYANHTFKIWRMYTGWDVGDTNNRYKDITGAITWYEDAYAPFPSQDRSTDPLVSELTDFTANDRFTFPITEIVERALRDNIPIRFYVWGSHSSEGYSAAEFYWKPSTTAYRPRIDFYYVYPIEFYESDGANSPDYTSNITEDEDGNYYLGPVERGATGSPTQGWIRNFTEQTQQIELFDDHPEWVTPFQTTGTGSGELDFITLASNAPSQLYTVVFYSSTQYEVKAEAYRDNAISYHPAINADASWRGNVSSNFTTPSGGLTIPAEAWQGTDIDSGDEFEIGVRGNTTDTAWPSDSNQQVEMCGDSVGVPDGKWRPVTGHRERTTAAVDIDAASVFVPIRWTVPAVWTVGETIFIHDADNYDEGTLTSVQERDLPALTFTGSGLNDCTISGNFNGNEDKNFRIEIDGTGTPDTFRWSNDGGSTWEVEDVNITGSAQALEDGVFVTFGATTGHTLSDRWDSAAKTSGLTIGSLSVTSNSYNPGTYVAQTLALRDVGAVDWALVDAASGASQSPASRLYVGDTTPFTENDVLHIQNVQSGGTNEEATIAAGGVNTAGGYLDLTSSLTGDYIEGDFVTVTGSGERAFWMRPVAEVTTAEELKTMRFNARIL